MRPNKREKEDARCADADHTFDKRRGSMGSHDGGFLGHGCQSAPQKGVALRQAAASDGRGRGNHGRATAHLRRPQLGATAATATSAPSLRRLGTLHGRVFLNPQFIMCLHVFQIQSKKSQSPKSCRSPMEFSPAIKHSSLCRFSPNGKYLATVCRRVIIQRLRSLFFANGQDATFL